MRKRIVLPVTLFMLALLVGCASGSGSGEETPAPAAPEPAAAPKTANVTLEPKSGSNLTGSATLTQVGDTVRFELHVNGAPDGQHAVHIHENGDCSAEDGTSAGGHWNPTGENHGQWGSPPHHLGDIGNMTVEGGHGTISLEAAPWTIGDGSSTDVVGKAIIVHAEPDDFTSQPTGAAGGRIGCGVIEPGA